MRFNPKPTKGKVVTALRQMVDMSKPFAVWLVETRHMEKLRNWKASVPHKTTEQIALAILEEEKL